MKKRKPEKEKMLPTYWKNIVLFAMGVVIATPAKAQFEQDIFIGMVVEEQGQLILERCSVGSPRYVLQNAQGAGDLLRALKAMRKGNARLQAELIARYRSAGEGHILDVSDVGDTKAGVSCHLLDAVDALFGTTVAQTVAPSSDALTWAALDAGSAAPEGTEVIGNGPYSYRFTLRHRLTDKPSAEADFALSARRGTDYELPFVADRNKVFQGRTDAGGQTPVFRLPVRLPDSAFDFRERFGAGPLGETFHLTDQNGTDFSGRPYMVITCTTPPRFFRGIADANGDTAYIASATTEKIQLRIIGVGNNEADEAFPKDCKDGTLETLADIGNPDKILEGHYYLSGVRETGSELRLKADGTFDWFISYGAVNQNTRGRWGRIDSKVTLVANRPTSGPILTFGTVCGKAALECQNQSTSGTPVFRADERFEWNDQAERFLQEQARLKKEQAILALCPWNIDAAVSPSAIAAGDQVAAGPLETTKATQARTVAETARDAATSAAAHSVANGATDVDREAASNAMTVWYNARYQMEQAFGGANLPLPQIGSPIIPAVCQLPTEDLWAKVPPAQWHRGIAIVVGDPVLELPLSRVDVKFVYDDGHREVSITARGGWAFAPIRKGASVTELVFTMPEPISRSETLKIAPITEGVQAVIADLQQVIEPPFATMTLEVKGHDLVPDNLPSGRYSRN